MVWTRDKERRARAHATSAQRDSTATTGRAEEKTTVKIHGYHQEGHHEREWNGEGRLGSGEVGQSDSTGYPVSKHYQDDTDNCQQ